MGEKMYTRLCAGLDDTGILIPTDENIYKHVKDLKKDYYISVYNYNESHKEQFDKTGSIAGIRDVLTNRIIFDFDDKDLDKARKDTLVTIKRLVDKGVKKSDINIYYSGKKGFHLTLETDKQFTPDEMKNVARSIAGDLATFDSRVYNSNRILRLAFTQHPDTKLYKIPISVDELSLPVVEIQTIAKDEYEVELPVKSSLPEAVNSLKITSKPKVEAKPLTSVLDLSKKPKTLSPWKYALSQGHFPSGQRNNALDIMARTYKAMGHDKTETYHLLKSMREKQAAIFGQEKFSKDEMYKNIIDQVFSEHNMGGTYSEDHFPDQLQKYLLELGVPRREDAEVAEKYKPKKIGDIGAKFEDFVLNYEKHLIKTGIKSIDDVLPMTPGLNIGIVAGAGVGKTSLALKILEYSSENNIPCILASIDMHGNRLYEKLLYRISGLSREELYAKFKSGEAEELKEKVREKFKNVYIYDKSGASIADIRAYHRMIEETEGVKIKLTMVDYFERIQSDISDATASSLKVANEWQDYINDNGHVGLMFVQPNKFSMSGGPDTPILNYTAIKGSSFLYQSFRAILSLWRPFYHPEWKDYDFFMKIAILKNDLGELGVFSFAWDGKRGEISELDDIQRDRLADLIKEKEGKNHDEDLF
jgi:hypothetical protein